MDQTKEQVGKFLEWLPTKIKEFKDKKPEEIATMLNKLYKTPDGEKQINSLWESFIQESKTNNKFKKGGKLNYLISLNKKGGKIKKCKCGCDLKTVFEKGGTVEKCSCGCKPNNIPKAQQGISIPTQNTGYWGRRFGNFNWTSTRDNQGPIKVAQIVDGNNMYRYIRRPSGHYVNETAQVIKNFNTPKADTTYYSPKGNPFTPKQMPYYTESFDNIFNKNKNKK